MSTACCRVLTVCCSVACSGSWLDDKASGQGVLEYSNGDLYEGQWDRDTRHGELLCCFLKCLC